MWWDFYSWVVKVTNKNTILVTLSGNNPVKVEERNLLNITLRKCKRCTLCLNDKTVKRIVKLMEF